jgi:hypothetical protein
MTLLPVSLTYKTVEQALLGSALQLRTINIQRLNLVMADFAIQTAAAGDNPVTLRDSTGAGLVPYHFLNEAIQVTPLLITTSNEIIRFMSIKAKFYYDSPQALMAGFNVFNFIIPFANQAITKHIDCIPIPGTYQPYPALPSDVETLEQFFFHNLYLLGASTVENYIEYNTYDVPDAQSGSVPHVFITVSLPYDYKKFCFSRSPINSLIKLFTTHYDGSDGDNSDPDVSQFAITNDFYVTNSTYFVNGSSNVFLPSQSKVTNDFYVTNSTYFTN